MDVVGTAANRLKHCRWHDFGEKKRHQTGIFQLARFRSGKVGHRQCGKYGQLRIVAREHRGKKRLFGFAGEHVQGFMHFVTAIAGSIIA